MWDASLSFPFPSLHSPTLPPLPSPGYFVVIELSPVPCPLRGARRSFRRRPIVYQSAAGLDRGSRRPAAVSAPLSPSANSVDRCFRVRLRPRRASCRPSPVTCCCYQWRRRNFQPGTDQIYYSAYSAFVGRELRRQSCVCLCIRYTTMQYKAES